MKDTALYEQLLGLKTPWSVKAVELSLKDKRVTVEVELKRGQVWADPTDATTRAHINGWSDRQWRHLDTCQYFKTASLPSSTNLHSEIDEEPKVEVLDWTQWVESPSSSGLARLLS